MCNYTYNFHEIIPTKVNQFFKVTADKTVKTILSIQNPFPNHNIHNSHSWVTVHTVALKSKYTPSR